MFFDGSRVFLPVRRVEKITWNKPVYNLEVEGDHDYVSVNFYSHNCNRNGDGFRASELKRKHPTFVKNGNVYENHRNKDPKKRIGEIKLSAYNEQMGRAELIFSLHKDKAEKHIQKLAKGEDLSGSMGCRVIEDVCQICLSRAPSPASYCEHAKLAMTKVLADGRQVYVDNPDPDFFDWSIVGRPADRIAYQFSVKTAGFGNLEVVNSVDLAKQAGLYLPVEYVIERADQRVRRKYATLKKLSEIEKEVETKLTPLDVKVRDADRSDEELSEGDVKLLKSKGLNEVLSALSEAKIVLPIRDFLKLVTDKNYNEAESLADDVEDSLPGIFTRLLDEEAESCCSDGSFDCDQAPNFGASISRLVDRLLPQLGMGELPLGKRIAISIIRAKPKLSREVRPDPAVEGLARFYARYKLAVLCHPGNESDGLMQRAVVLQNLPS
jgi:hypothetical protein